MTDRTYLFERKPIPKAVLTLAIPTIISSLIMVVYNMADTYFVTLLNDPVQTAAVTLAGPLLLAFNAVSNLFGVGTSSVMSRALGQKDHQTVREASSIGLYASLLSALLFSILVLIFYQPVLSLIGANTQTAEATKSYIDYAIVMGAVPSIVNVVFSYLVRAQGSAIHASVGTMSGALLNIILDPIFILPWGLNMGAAGAGLATMLSNVVAVLYFIILNHRQKGKTLISMSFKDFSFRKDLWTKIANVGIPASIQNLLNVTGLTILNNFTAIYGANAIAAMGIASKIQLLPIMMAIGATQGVMPLISYNYANQNFERMKQSILFVGKWMVVFMLSILLLGSFFSDTIISLFMNNSEVIYYGSHFLKGLLIAMPFLAIDFLAVTVFQSIGDGKKALVFAILRKIVFEIPGLFILRHLFSIYGLVYAQVIAEIVLAIMALYFLKDLFKTDPSRL